jgi:hypothetical protein
MKHILMTLMFAFLPPAFASAQEQPAETQKQQPPQIAIRPAETGQAVNIKIDVTITEQASATPPTVRAITLLVSDSSVGRIRTVSPSHRAGELNVDARPRIVQGDRLHLMLTVEYRPGVSGDTETPPSLNQSLSVMLQDGKPLVVSQSADPNSERKVKLEVKATILH